MVNDFLTIIVSLMTVFCFRPEIFRFSDGVFLRLFGKELSARGTAIQYIFLGIVSLLLFLILRALLRRGLPAGVPAVILCAAALFLCFRLCALQVIRRDDYWEIKNALRYTLPEYLAYECTHAQGRYFSFFLKGFCHYLDPDRYLRIMLGVNVILLCLGMSGLFREIRRRSSGDLPPLPLSLCAGICLGFGVIFMSPAVWEVWFWGAGGLIYGSGIICSIFVLYALLGHKPALLIPGILCGCGCSELAAASICLFTFAALLKPLLHGRKPEAILIVGFILSVLCSGAALLMSQDLHMAGQMAAGSNPGGFFRRIISASAAALHNISGFGYSRIEYLLLFCVLAFSFGAMSGPGRLPRRDIIFGMIVLLAAAFGTAFINAFLNFSPPRTLSFGLTWLFLAAAAGCFLLGTRTQTDCPGSALLLSCALCALIVFSFYRGNHEALTRTRMLWEKRDAALQELQDKTKPAETCFLPVIGSIDRDLMEDPEYEFNIVAAYYYDLPQVTAADPCE